MKNYDCVVIDQHGSVWLFTCSADNVAHAEEQAMDEQTVRVVFRITLRNAMVDEILSKAPWVSIETLTP